MVDDVLDRLKEALSDRYKIESELDRGGMAVVYLAEDLRHHRKVAVKVLQPALSASLGAQRFLREIEVLANLQHPNILTLIDSGEVDGLPYYVMPFVEGQSLRARLDREGALPLEEAVQIAAEVAEGLESAHQRGVVHRDVKPANVLISGGHAVVADFGIAAALNESALGRLTEAGISLGSPAYMSTEQASGEGDLDGRTDVYALGCVLYEMLAGKAPFEGSIKTLVTRKFLGDYQPLKELRPDVPAEIEAVVSKAMDTEPDRRFPSAKAFREALLAGLPQAVPKGWGRRRTMAASASVLLVAIIALVAIQRIRSENQLIIWATQTLTQVEDLVDVGQYTEALALAEEVEEVFPDDTVLAKLLPLFSFTIPIRTDPPGARVYIQSIDSPEGEWEFLGETPLEEVRFAGLSGSNPDGVVSHGEDGSHRLRFELEGYRDRELYKTAVVGMIGQGLPPMDPVRLAPIDSLPEEMVLIPGFTQDTIAYGDYFMDRYEVTNHAFKEFVDAGGYQRPEHWVHPFVENGVELTFQEAMALFKDQTGRSGPSTWRLGTYPEHQGEFPVGGVSWHEAAAYAHFVGKEIPTTLHWIQARRYYRRNSFVIVPRSNLGTDGPRPVGQDRAMTTVGVYDHEGNVREWCYNEVRQGGRATRGGAWTDAPFHVGWIIPKPEFDRHETNGIRLVRTFDDEGSLEALRAPVGATVARDFWAEEPVSDVEYEVFRRLYAYDSFSLNAVVERTDTFEHWVREKVAFDLPYGERGGVVLYLPMKGLRPLTPVVYWGGSGLLSTKTIDEEWVSAFDYLVQDGRAVAIPIFKGAYERDDSLFSITHGSIPGGWTGNTYRDFVIQWVKDLSVSIDYLESREDIDAENVGYFGFSFGGQAAPIVLAVEPRIDAAVLNVGGLYGTRYMPEIDPFNFVTRVRTPILMINGEYDIVFPYETAQRPMYELLGTDPEHKFHYTVPAAHNVPKIELITETLNWFDKYLGVPGGG